MERVMNSILRHAFFHSLQRQVQCAVTFPQQHQDSSPAVGTATVLANSSHFFVARLFYAEIDKGGKQDKDGVWCSEKCPGVNNDGRIRALLIWVSLRTRNCVNALFWARLCFASQKTNSHISTLQISATSVVFLTMSNTLRVCWGTTNIKTNPQTRGGDKDMPCHQRKARSGPHQRYLRVSFHPNAFQCLK